MTQAIISIKREIRRALQIPLNAAAISAGLVDSNNVPHIQWKGIPFDRTGRPNYLAVEIAFADVIVHEIGPHPQVEGRGHVTVNCHSPLDEGEDANDALARIVSTAYPYASTPTFGGVAVNIDKMQAGSYGSDGPWLTGLVSVDWNIYRRS